MRQVCNDFDVLERKELVMIIAKTMTEAQICKRRENCQKNLKTSCQFGSALIARSKHSACLSQSGSKDRGPQNVSCFAYLQLEQKHFFAWLPCHLKDCSLCAKKNKKR